MPLSPCLLPHHKDYVSLRVRQGRRLERLLMHHASRHQWVGLLVIAILVVSSGCGSNPKSSANGTSLPDVVLSAPDTASSSTGNSDVISTEDSTRQWTNCEFEGQWGCPCKTSDDCDSGYCIEGEDGYVCSKTCIDTCPPGWLCRQANANDAVFICLPRYVTLCRPCSKHADCGSQGLARCIPNVADNGSFVNGSFCAAACSDAEPCPEGYDCADINLGDDAPTKQCVPTSGECSCSQTEVNLSATTSCSRNNEFGTCKGSRTCSEAGLTLCDATAPSAEICDGFDNDCDGQTDEVDAAGCTLYYPDNDGDGAGIGEGQCLCQNPGPGYAVVAGDCNDVVKDINPAAKEVCNDLDDNCINGTDEPGASGCTVYYKDKDGDGFGDPDDATCVCPSKVTPELISKGGDCKDDNVAVKPTAVESCNGGIDDNCNGETDEEGANGCQLYYVDKDKDGFGNSKTGKCLCGPTGDYLTKKGQDCEDELVDVFPGSKEKCNNIDDDCNGTTDDGDAPKTCPQTAGAEASCTAGVCGIAVCPKGYFDIDGDTKNGCECQADANFGVAGGTCKAPINVGDLGDGGSKVIVSGNVMPSESGDWYKFKAIDGPDTNGCDTFNVRARFLKNPGATYVLDLYRGSCAGQAQMCTNETEVGWTVNFGGKNAYGVFTALGKVAGSKTPSPNPKIGGECKCSTATSATGQGKPGMNLCINNTAEFWVRVHVAANKQPACVSYQVELWNGPN
ncbi:MAG TPA: hypothetical protein DCQ06_11450 [Myxococcales bacterium]|nr:hypothetical protein [Myxococcales bacterium]HAN32204.1 hypothetical protein [Myxococcales bacterium]